VKVSKIAHCGVAASRHASASEQDERRGRS
jgi:hypothetical protein